MSDLSIIEFAEKRRDEEMKAYEQSGKDEYWNDMRYWVAYIDGAKAQLEETQKNYQLFPAIGSPVYKILWEREAAASRYFQNKTRNKSIIVSDYQFYNALADKTSVITIEQRPMCKTDLTKLGTFTFLTAEEAEKVLEQYKSCYKENSQ